MLQMFYIMPIKLVTTTTTTTTPTTTTTTSTNNNNNNNNSNNNNILLFQKQCTWQHWTTIYNLYINGQGQIHSCFLYNPRDILLI